METHRAAVMCWWSKESGLGLMPTVFTVVSLLFGDPRLTLEDTVFDSRMACRSFLHQQYDASTMEVFRLDCIPKTKGQ
jgi:hypothetical protein